MKNLLYFLVCLVVVSIAACSGDGNTITDPNSGGSGGVGGGGGGAGGGAGVVRFGSGTGAGFQEGVLELSSGSLAAGGSTTLTATFDIDGLLSTVVTSVTFSSVCVAQGLATATSPVDNITGIVTSTYVATGCSGDDVITASAIVAGATLTATGTVTVAGAQVGSIEFVSVTPQLIGLQGTGGLGLSETSTVIFKVVDSTGGPVAGTDVTFSLDTAVGGIALTPGSATSGSNGEVQTVVQSGTVATTVRVTATIAGPPVISTQSSQLVVSTGIPHQDSFSVAVLCPNVEAFVNDGVEVPITVRLTDRFQNPVPDGTAVTLNAEGGSIQSQCTTATTATQSGVCSVTWTSSNPRPVDGRVTILATAIGEESFSDVNGNGVFDDPDSFSDIAEPFRDDNENSVHDAGEFFLDFNQDFTFSPPDGQFNGLLCQDSTGRCSTASTLGISGSNIIIMSGEAAVITDNLGLPVLGDSPLGDLTAPGTVTFMIGDARGQVMPAGTTVKASVTNGQLVGPSSFDMPCTSFDGPWAFSFTVDADTTPDSGLLLLEVTTPGGILSLGSITIND